MKRNDFLQLINLVLKCLTLFLVLDAVSVLLASSLVFFKIGIFSFDWKDIFSSFFQTGYVGGIVLGAGIWLKIKIQEYQSRKKDNNFN